MSAQPATVRRPRPAPVAGPMPPRWERLAVSGYSHTEIDLRVTPIDGRLALDAASECALQSLSIAAADLVDLLRWLERGGR